MGYPVTVLPDAEGVARAWLRTVDLGDASGQVFFAVPNPPSGAADVPLPLVTVHRSGGVADDELPLDAPTLMFSAWAETKQSAAAVAGRLIAVLRAAAGTTVNGAHIDGVSVVTGPTWAPDEAAHKARYLVTCTLHLRPVGA